MQSNRFETYLHQKRESLPSHLEVGWEGFKQMYTKNNSTRRMENPKMVERLADQFDSSLGGSSANGSIVIDPVIIDRKSLLAIDEDRRTLNELDDQELLDAPPESLVATKAMVTIRVKGVHEKYSPMLVINMTDRGEEIAFGEQVHICTNMTILHADHRFSTFGRGRISLEELLTEAARLMNRNEQIFEEDLALMERLQQERVTRSAWHEWVGELYSRIHYVNGQRLSRRISTLSAEEKELPVTATELSRILMEATTPSHDEYQWEGDVTNKWNVLNYGTEKLKLLHGSSPNTVLKANSNWANMVIQRDFSLN